MSREQQATRTDTPEVSAKYGVPYCSTQPNKFIRIAAFPLRIIASNCVRSIHHDPFPHVRLFQYLWKGLGPTKHCILSFKLFLITMNWRRQVAGEKRQLDVCYSWIGKKKKVKVTGMIVHRRIWSRVVSSTLFEEYQIHFDELSWPGNMRQIAWVTLCHKVLHPWPIRF